MSEIRVDKIISHAGNSAPDLPQGATISGVTTVSTLSATTVSATTVNATTLGAGVTLANIDSVGLITARNGINVTGRILLGTTTEGQANADDLTIAGAGHAGITVRSGTSNNGSVFFSDGTSGVDEYRGWVQYTHTTDYLTFGTNAGERLRIGSAGQIGIAGTNYGASGQVITSQGNSAAPQWATPALGFGMIDSWYLRMGAANETNVSNATYSNVVLGDWNTSTDRLRWERFGLNANGQVNVGSAMTVSSSGVFTFPTTGIYQANLKLNFNDYSSTNFRWSSSIQGTTDNGSNWHTLVSDVASKMTGDTAAPSRPFLPAFNVTNTSTHKLKVLMSGGGYGYSTYGGGVGVGASYFSQWKFITITKIN